MSTFLKPDPHKVHMVIGTVVSQGPNGTVNVRLDDDGILEQVSCVGSASTGDQAIVLIADLEAWAITGPPAAGVGGGGGIGGAVMQLLAGLGISVTGSSQYPTVSIDKSVTDQWYGGPKVEAVDPGLGISVGGTATRPAVAVDRVQTDTWYPDKVGTETMLNALDQRVDTLLGQLVYAGTYNAQTRQIESLSSMVAVEFPDAVPNGYGGAVGKPLTSLPAAPWNAKHFFIVSAEGPHHLDDGIDYISGSPVNTYNVGDWILSNGRGALTRIDTLTGVSRPVTVEPMMPREVNSWLHMTYSARLVLASSIVVDTVTAGLPLTEDTVQKALGWLRLNKVNRSGDTMTGYLTLPAANPTLPDHATRKGYVDDNIHEHLRYNRSYQINGQDLNLVLTSGFYDGSGMGNAPNGNWWYIEVQRHSNSANWVRQIARYFYDTELVYSRTRQNGAWSAWTRGYARYADKAGSAASAGTANDATHLTGWHGSAFVRNDQGLWMLRAGSYAVPGGNGSTSLAHCYFPAYGPQPHVLVSCHTTVPYTTVRMFSGQGIGGNRVDIRVNRTNGTNTWFHAMMLGG